MSDIGNVTKFEKPEKERTYYFPNNEKVVLKEVTELVVRPSGTHRLKTADGKSHIVPAGWIHIELDIDDWTV
jgi:hypothetical protein